MLLISGVCLLGLSNPITASAQCVTPPTCSELGYTKSASECSGHTFLKCPFNTAVGYCDLGTGTTPIPDPTPSYKVGDSYSYNGAVIGKVIEVGTNTYTVASQPRTQANPSYDGLNTYCQNLTLGGGTWFVPPQQEKTCITITNKFNLDISWGYLIMQNSSCSISNTRCFCYSDISQNSSYIYYYSCIAYFSK